MPVAVTAAVVVATAVFLVRRWAAVRDVALPDKTLFAQSLGTLEVVAAPAAVAAVVAVAAAEAARKIAVLAGLLQAQFHMPVVADDVGSRAPAPERGTQDALASKASALPMGTGHVPGVLTPQQVAQQPQAGDSLEDFLAHYLQVDRLPASFARALHCRRASCVCFRALRNLFSKPYQLSNNRPL